MYKLFNIDKKGCIYINTGKSTNSNGFKKIILKQKHWILLTYNVTILG